MVTLLSFLLISKINLFIYAVYAVSIELETKDSLQDSNLFIPMMNLTIFLIVKKRFIFLADVAPQISIA